MPPALASYYARCMSDFAEPPPAPPWKVQEDPGLVESGPSAASSSASSGLQQTGDAQTEPINVYIAKTHEKRRAHAEPMTVDCGTSPEVVGVYLEKTPEPRTAIACSSPMTVDSVTIPGDVRRHHRDGYVAGDGWTDLPSYLERSTHTPTPHATTGAAKRRRDKRKKGNCQIKTKHTRSKRQRRKKNARTRKMIEALDALGDWVAETALTSTV